MASPVGVDFSKVKFYYMLDSKSPFSIAVSSDVKNAILKVVDHLQSVHGVEVKEVNFKEIRLGFAIFIHLAMASLEKEIKDLFTGGEFELNPAEELFKTMSFQSKLTIGPVICMNLKKIPLIFSDHKLPKMREQLQKLQEKLNTILDKKSLLIMPAFPIPAHYHYESIPLIESLGYMAIFNILGNPVTQCPVGLNENKLPLGFQIIGAKGQDHLTIAFAREMEKAFGGWVPPNSNE